MVEEALTEDLNKAPENMEGEANLRGHLRADNEGNNGQEENGSSSYIPQEKNKDVQLQYALDLLRGVKSIGINARKKIDVN